MIRVTSSKFRENMPYYLGLISKGHRVVLLHYDEPVAEIYLPVEDRILRASAKTKIPAHSRVVQL